MMAGGSSSLPLVRSARLSRGGGGASSSSGTSSTRWRRDRFSDFLREEDARADFFTEVLVRFLERLTFHACASAAGTRPVGGATRPTAISVARRRRRTYPACHTGRPRGSGGPATPVRAYGFDPQSPRS